MSDNLPSFHCVATRRIATAHCSSTKATAVLGEQREAANSSRSLGQCRNRLATRSARAAGGQGLPHRVPELPAAVGVLLTRTARSDQVCVESVISRGRN